MSGIFGCKHFSLSIMNSGKKAGRLLVNGQCYQKSIPMRISIRAGTQSEIPLLAQSYASLRDARTAFEKAYIGRQLRADAVKVSVFRQRRDNAGAWTDVATESKTAVDLENAILTRARQIRVDTASQR